jgi:FAD/FMN-containing dehydrogenase
MSIALSRDPAVRASLAADASGLYLEPDAAARPASAAEVVEVLRRAAADGLAVTAAGGQTSTTGASITARGVLLSLRAGNVSAARVILCAAAPDAADANHYRHTVHA